jgi:hypothetical protein
MTRDEEKESRFFPSFSNGEGERETAKEMMMAGERLYSLLDLFFSIYNNLPTFSR